MPRRRRPSSQILSPTALLPPTTLTDNLPLPKLLIFDLDYTLWPFWADTHPTPPLHCPPLSPSADATITIYPKATSLTDKYNIKFTTYEYTPILLHSLATLAPQIPICVASRTESPKVAEEFLKGIWFDLPFSGGEEGEGEKEEEGRKQMLSYIAHKEIYPAKSKLVHFSKIEAWWRENHPHEGGEDEKTGFDWKDAIFFDDESRNRDVERKLGVSFCLVDDNVGASRDTFDQAIWEWRGTRLGLVKGES